MGTVRHGLRTTMLSVIACLLAARTGVDATACNTGVVLTACFDATTVAVR